MGNSGDTTETCRPVLDRETASPGRREPRRDDFRARLELVRRRRASVPPCISHWIRQRVPIRVPGGGRSWSCFGCWRYEPGRCGPCRRVRSGLAI